MNYLYSNHLLLITAVVALVITTGIKAAAKTVEPADNYAGVYRGAQPSEQNSMRVRRLPANKYACEIKASYCGRYKIDDSEPAKVECFGSIQNNLAVFKNKDLRHCAFFVQFQGEKAIVIQVGESADCGWGDRVNAITGVYSRSSKRRSKAPRSWTALAGNHYEDENGRPAFPGTFSEALPFHGGMAAVSLNKKWGFINRSGKLVVPYKYTAVQDFDKGLAEVSVDGKKWGLIDASGKVVVPSKFSDAQGSNKGLAVLSADGKRWSYVDDTTSKSVTKSIKGTIKSSSNGLSVVEVAGRDFVIDKNGDRVGTNQYEELNPFIEGIASFRQGNLWGAIDSKATVIIPAEYQNELLFKNGLAKFFFASSKYGFVDKSGTVVLSATYDDAEDFQEGLAAVKSGALWCFIDKTGASVIPPQFSQCYGGFVNGRCFVRVKDSPYISIIDKTGKRLAQLPLQCRNIIGGRTIISERAAICQILDWDWDDNGRQVPVDQDGKLLPGFGGKNVKYWKSEGLFVVSGPAG